MNTYKIQFELDGNVVSKTVEAEDFLKAFKKIQNRFGIELKHIHKIKKI